MRNSTGSPIFSDFKSDLSRVVRFPTAGQGERRPWVRGCQLHFFLNFIQMQMHDTKITVDTSTFLIMLIIRNLIEKQENIVC